MTVCLATLFRWNYAPTGKPDDIGLAAIVVSDRMITFGDVQYEPQQMKVAAITAKTLILIAGDYSLHSQAIKATVEKTRSNPQATPHNIALVYSREIQAINQRAAEDMFLAPLGLNTDTFLSQQREMSDSFVSSITAQMQSYSGDEGDALIVGSDGEKVQIYTVNSRGGVSSHNDVGFAAIGVGAWHAQSRLMFFGYNSWLYFPEAIAVTFAAKKAAEIAPGVGGATDIHLVFKEGFERLIEPVERKLGELYQTYETERLAIQGRVIDELRHFIRVLPNHERLNAEVQRFPSENVRVDEVSGRDTIESSGGNETQG